MVQAIEPQQSKDYQAVAEKLSQTLIASAIERERDGGLPEAEISLLKESG